MALLGHSCYGWHRHADSWKKEKECAFYVHLEEYQQHLGVLGRCVCRLCRLQSRVLGQAGRLVGMFLLGLLLPGIGTYCTGTILKEELLKLCGLIGVMMGVGFLHDLCTGAVISLAWPMLMAVSSAITLVAPGHYLNYQSKKQRK